MVHNARSVPRADARQLQEITRTHAERFRDPHEIQDAEVPHTPLDARHVAPINARRVGQRLLRHLLRAPLISDPVAEALQIRVGSPRHTAMVERCCRSIHGLSSTAGA
jgi:hypothetical protein